jgi:hypothetical protein
MRVVLHVGPPRTGSTFLQSRVFPNIPGVYDVRSRDTTFMSQLRDLLDENPLFLDIGSARDMLLSRLVGVKEEIVLISAEECFGSYTSLVESAAYHAKQFHDNCRKTALLAALFEGAKVFVMFRRQDAWIVSAYMIFIQNMYTFGIHEFLAPDGGGGVWPYAARSTKPCCDIRTLDWSVYIKNYHRAFGRDNVLALPQEMMREDLKGFLGRFCNFLGVAPYAPDIVPIENRSYSALSLRIALLINRFCLAPGNRFGFIPTHPFSKTIALRRQARDTWLLWALAGISRRISLRWILSDVLDRAHYRRADPLGPSRRTEIVRQFEEGNRRLAEKTGLDLSRYGYYGAPPGEDPPL